MERNLGPRDQFCPFTIQWLLHVPLAVTYKLFLFPARYIYVFHMVLTHLETALACRSLYWTRSAFSVMTKLNF
jgi:hypothetical protein